MFNNTNPLNKISERNKLKICYSCANNISNIIYNHNNNLIDKSQIGNQRTNKLLCNCRNKEDCPMGGMCNSEKVVERANIFPTENSLEDINWRFIKKSSTLGSFNDRSNFCQEE